MRMENPRVKAKVIVEMLGTPKEHVEGTLRAYVDALPKKEKVEVLAADFAEPEERDELFMVFVELDILFKDTLHLLDFCFESMPSSVEVLEPETLSIDAASFTGILNDLQARLHTVDMSMKTLSAQTSIVDRNAMNVLHNFIKFIVKEGGKTPAQMAPIVGLKQEQLEVFLGSMVGEGKLVRDGDVYRQP